MNRPRSISEVTDRYWERVATTVAVPDSSLGLFRWIVGLYLLIAQAPHAAWVDDMPRALFDPPVLSPSYLLGAFPPSPFLTIVDIVGLLALVAMTIGWRTRAATLTVAASRLVGGAFTYSFGKIDHDILVTALLVCMAVAGWGRSYSVDSRHDDRGDIDGSSRATMRGLGLFATVLAFGFLTAGAPKAPHWIDLDPSTSGFLSWFYPNRLTLGRDRMLAGLVPGTPAVVLELADVAAVALELLAFPALLAGRRTWRLFLLVASTFHLANALVLNIAFNEQALAYLVFVDLRFLATALVRRTVALAAACCAISACVWHIVARLGGFGSPTAFVTGYATHLDAILYLAIPTCTFAIACLAHDVGSARRAGVAQTPATA